MCILSPCYCITLNFNDIDNSPSLGVSDPVSKPTIDMFVFIGIIIFEVSCMDNDEPGPGFTDTVDGQSDISQVEGMFEDQVNQGDCGMGGGFEMIWYPTNNYTGEDYTFDGTENDLRNIWDSNGNGLGTWAASITANIETNPVPVFGEVLDSDEDFQITWTAITYQLDITPIIDDVDT